MRYNKNDLQGGTVVGVGIKTPGHTYVDLGPAPYRQGGAPMKNPPDLRDPCPECCDSPGSCGWSCVQGYCTGVWSECTAGAFCGLAGCGQCPSSGWWDFGYNCTCTANCADYCPDSEDNPPSWPDGGGGIPPNIPRDIPVVNTPDKESRRGGIIRRQGGTVNTSRLRQQNGTGWTGRDVWPCESMHGDCFPTDLGGSGEWGACFDPIGWCSCATNWYDPSSGNAQAYSGIQECCPNDGCNPTQQPWYQQCDCYKIYDAQNMGLGWANDCHIYECFNCGHSGAHPFWFLIDGNESAQWVYEFCWAYGNEVMSCSQQGLLECPQGSDYQGTCVTRLSNCENDGCPDNYQFCNGSCIHDDERCIEGADKYGGRRGGTARGIANRMRTGGIPKRNRITDWAGNPCPPGLFPCNTHETGPYHTACCDESGLVADNERYIPTVSKRKGGHIKSGRQLKGPNMEWDG